MRQVLRSTLRWLFGAQALLMLGALVVGTRHQLYNSRVVHEPVGYYVTAVLLMLPSAMAYLTLLKAVAGRRNYWAASTCLLDLLLALPLLYFARLHHILPIAVSGLYLMLNVAGVWLFLQRNATRKAPPPMSSAGDRTSRISDVLVTLLLIAGTWKLWELWARWADPRSSINTHFPWDLLVLLLAILVLSAIHECGHALVAGIFQMKLLSFTISSFAWRRIEGRWHFQFVVPFLGGAVSIVRVTPNPDWQEILMIAAGPAANLVTTPLFLWAALRLRSTGDDYLLYFFGCLAVISLASAIFNLFPIRVGDCGYSDGAQIIQILSRSPALDYRRAINALQATLFTPLRPRDLDPALFQRAAALRTGHITGLHAHLCAAEMFADRGEIGHAAAEIAAAEACYNDFSISLPSVLHTIFIYHHAVYRQDAAATALWWDRMNKKKIERKNINYFLSLSAVAWIQCRRDDAEDAWRLAEAETAHLPNCGAWNVDRDQLALLRTRLDGPPPGPPREPVTVPAADSLEPAAQLQPAHQVSDRKPVLAIAAVSAVLLAAVTAAPAIPISALVWHFRHGDSMQLANYSIKVPLHWSAEYRGVDYVSLTRISALDSRLTPRISIMPPDPDDGDGPPIAMKSDQELLHATRQEISEMNKNAKGLSATFVLLKASRLSFYCVRMNVASGASGAYVALNCRTPISTNYFFYDGPPDYEPEAETILSSIQ
jgi:Zn-dependent protease